MNLESGVLQVHIEDIIPNRFQPRLTFDEQGLKELSDSIREHGIIQPLVLRKLGNKYEIIAGERRYKGAQMAGLTTVPAVIANIDDNKSAEVALVENVQRRDLTAIEEARSYRSLLDKGYLTQEQLAKRMGLSQPAIANKLRLLNLDEEVQQALLEERISERHARTLLGIKDKEIQKEWLHRIINERLTVRQLDLELKKLENSNQNVLFDDEDEGAEEIPLVSSGPSVEDIRANAMDIKDANRLSKGSSEPIETLEEFPNNTNLNESIKPTPFATFNPNMASSNSFTSSTITPEFNVSMPNSTSNFMSQNNFNDFNGISNNQNKFFDIAGRDTNAINSMSTSMSQDKNLNSNSFEVFDAPTMNNSFDTSQNITEPTSPTPIENQETSFETNLNTSFDMNPNNRFFKPISEPPREISIINKRNTDINPMDAVANLTNSNQTLSEIQSKMDLKDAISTIRSCIEGLGDKGFFIDVEEIDFDSNYQITIRINKDN